MVGAFKIKKKGSTHHASPTSPVKKTVKPAAPTPPRIVLDDMERDKY
jgi:hypothetical protein